MGVIPCPPNKESYSVLVPTGKAPKYRASYWREKLKA